MTFTARLAVTDGGSPLVFFEDDDGGFVWRGDDIVGEGGSLAAAWDNYLYTVDVAHVADEELARMWAEYDRAEATP